MSIKSRKKGTTSKEDDSEFKDLKHNLTGSKDLSIKRSLTYENGENQEEDNEPLTDSLKNNLPESNLKRLKKTNSQIVASTIKYADEVDSSSDSRNTIPQVQSTLDSNTNAYASSKVRMYIETFSNTIHTFTMKNFDSIRE